ncbi:hypothetical protein Psuf_092260 [Phytohabitans suffuscus]|uniref:Uncharacterized protein n=1 Tax=Phytohabitans suffuscus TaxID=624315 RepID=A0A6F8Z0Y9_9ACTN|nr:hypothetical protein Psuf_092260 [Phytohabitans suffuscus]
MTGSLPSSSLPAGDYRSALWLRAAVQPHWPGAAVQPIGWGYQEQQLVQQQLPPPQVVEAPGATVTVRPPVAVVPIWPEKLSMDSPPMA